VTLLLQVLEGGGGGMGTGRSYITVISMVTEVEEMMVGEWALSVYILSARSASLGL